MSSSERPSTSKTVPSIAAIVDVSAVDCPTVPLAEISYNLAINSLLAPPPVPNWARKFIDPDDEQPIWPARYLVSCAKYHGLLVKDIYLHPLVAAVDLAFREHRPIVLSPDMFWLLVSQGVAHHIHAHAKELRPRFVSHSGQPTLIVLRDDFQKGSPENPWSEVINAFSEQIREHIGPTTHDLFQPRFSTTTHLEQIAANVVLMEGMQSYFAYQLHSLCGIPQVVLEGTLADWEHLAKRVEALAQFGPTGWSAILLPILQKLVASARGDIDSGFWKSFYKGYDASGGYYITGWITAFFPYLKNCRTGQATELNRWHKQGGERLVKLLDPHNQGDQRAFPDGPTTEDFPSGLARAPFVWHYRNEKLKMEFLAGFVGVAQDAHTLRLRPEIGWAVARSAH